jgi:hypothetical protein
MARLQAVGSRARTVGSKASTYQTSPLGEWGVAFKALSPLPTAVGLAGIAGFEYCRIRAK